MGWLVRSNDGRFSIMLHLHGKADARMLHCLACHLSFLHRILFCDHCAHHYQNTLLWNFSLFLSFFPIYIVQCLHNLGSPTNCIGSRKGRGGTGLQARQGQVIATWALILKL